MGRTALPLRTRAGRSRGVRVAVPLRLAALVETGTVLDGRLAYRLRSLVSPAPRVVRWGPMASIYDLQMESITGEQVDFDQFRDQVLLIVNVASA